MNRQKWKRFYCPNCDWEKDGDIKGMPIRKCPKCERKFNDKFIVTEYSTEMD